MRGGSGLASTLTVGARSLVEARPDVRADGRWPSYTSGLSAGKCLICSSTVALPQGKTMFSRPTHALIQALVGMSATDESAVPSGTSEHACQKGDWCQAKERLESPRDALRGFQATFLCKSVNAKNCYWLFARRARGRQDWRSTRWVESTTRAISSGFPLIRRRSIVAAVRPNSRRGA